jgi:hypothetical protein
MTAARRRMRVKEHRREAERLVVAKLEAFERAQARQLRPKTLLSCLPAMPVVGTRTEAGMCRLFGRVACTRIAVRDRSTSERPLLDSPQRPCI